MQIKKSGLRVALLAGCLLAAACGDDDGAGMAGLGATSGGVGGGGVSGGGLPSGGTAAGGMTGGTAAGGMTAGTVGGTGAGTGGDCGTESFAAIYQDIFANPTYMCSTPVCHGRTSEQSGSVGNLELMTKELAYMDLVGVAADSALCGDVARTRVVPGDAAMSLLVQKLRAETVMCGSVMPVTGDAISDADLMRITNWINAGACDN